MGSSSHDSLSDDAKKRGRSRGYTITVRDIEIANGEGFLVALTGTMMRMVPPPSASRSPTTAL